MYAWASTSRLITGGALAATLVGCGERADQTTEARYRALAQELQPEVEEAVGLRFRTPPQLALRSPAQLQQYLVAKLYDEYPPEEFELLSAAYKLFRLVPDTLDLRALLLELYTEQVAGYYDPDSSTLYVVEGAVPEGIRLTLAHELVHALQDQYVPLDSLLSVAQNNDRRMAAQAVMEGQATVTSLRAMISDEQLDNLPELWGEYRDAVRNQMQQMPVLARAPLVLRDGLIFPYVGGADFVRWFSGRYADTVPFGPRLPQSTEQILHPERYAAGDLPVELAFRDTTGLRYHDNLGEFETRILLTELTGSEAAASSAALGWGGDRYGVLDGGAPGQYALVWWSVWDDARRADRFHGLLDQEWQRRPRAVRRSIVQRHEVEGRPAVVLVDAPEGWQHWGRVPGVRIVR